MKKIRIIALTNKKGGCGKTTSCVNIAGLISKKKYKTLIIDMDPQGHALLHLGITKNNVSPLFVKSLTDINKYSDSIIFKKNEYLYITGGGKFLEEYEKNLTPNSFNPYALKQLIYSYFIDNFDFIFIDTPPSLEFLTTLSLVASKEVIIPTLTNFLSINGVEEVVDFIYEIKTEYNPDIEILGILPTFFNHRTNIGKFFLEKLKKSFGEDKILPPIRNNVALAEAPNFGKLIDEYKKNSLGNFDYTRVVLAILIKHKK